MYTEIEQEVHTRTQISMFNAFWVHDNSAFLTICIVPHPISYVSISKYQDTPQQTTKKSLAGLCGVHPQTSEHHMT